jgi:hypothetical protein
VADLVRYVGLDMELIADAKEVLLKAWSVRMALLSALFSGAEALALVLPYLDGIFPTGVLAGLGAGLLPGVDAAIAAMTGTEGDAARIEWEYAQEVRRDSPLLAGMIAALGLTSEQVDGLFVAAAGL